MKKRYSCVFWLCICLVLMMLPAGDTAWSAPPQSTEFLLIFDDLTEGTRFTSYNQPYEDLDSYYGMGVEITSSMSGYPEVVEASNGNHVLKNFPPLSDEFGCSHNDTLIMTFDGFSSDHVSVKVGLESDAGYWIIAHLHAYQGGTYITSDSVFLNWLAFPPDSAHEMIVESSTGAIDRIEITYGYFPDGIYDACPPEFVDDVYIHVWPGDPPDPPEDTIAPVVQIEYPSEGETVNHGVTWGTVEENSELASITATTADGGPYPLPFYKSGPTEYTFSQLIPFESNGNFVRVQAEDAAGNSDTAEVNFTWDPPVYIPPPDYYPATLDFRATGMEVTQAIQGWDMIYPDPDTHNEVHLIAGKTTAVRVYGWIDGSTIPIPGVRCILYGYADAARTVELPGSPLVSIDPVTLEPGESYIDQRPNPDKSFNFILPAEWTEIGTLYLLARVNSLGHNLAVIPETYLDYRNDVWQELHFYDTETFCINVYRIQSTNEGNALATTAECDDNISLLEYLYPVAPERLNISHQGTMSTNQILTIGTDTQKSTALSNLLDEFIDHVGSSSGETCDHTVYLGLTETGITHRGVTLRSERTSLSVARLLTEANSYFYQIKTGHEIGHALQLGHVDSMDPDCSGVDASGGHEPKPPYEPYPVYTDTFGVPYFDASIGDWGTHIQPDNSLVLIDPANDGDMMSYCGSDRWISPYTWDVLFDRFYVLSSSMSDTNGTYQSEAPLILIPHLEISGTIKPGGTASLNPARVKNLPDGKYDYSGVGSYDILLLDGSGNKLFGRHFDPEPVSNQENYGHFREIVPFATGTREIRLTGPGIIKLINIEAGPAVPQVTVTFPDGGENWPATGVQQIFWSARDLDGDFLTFTVLYSNDMGASWKALATRVSGLGINVDLRNLAGGDESCLIRVLASDGINQGSDTSDQVFSKTGQPPMVRIVSPERTAVYDHGDQIILRGRAWDLEDANIPPDQMTWRSDRDGLLGMGPLLTAGPLAPGLHRIQFAAKDTNHMEARDEVSIFAVALPFDCDRDGDVDGRDIACVANYNEIPHVTEFADFCFWYGR